MSFGPTLYSKRLYSEGVYSGLPGTVMLSETVSLSDTLTLNMVVAFLESLGIADSPISVNTIRILNDAMNVFDTSAKTGQVQLTDFVLLNEFISPRLGRIVTEWTQHGGQTPGTALTLYSKPLYAQNVYSGTSAITWKAVLLSTGPGFTNEDGHKN